MSYCKLLVFYEINEKNYLLSAYQNPGIVIGLSHRRHPASTFELIDKPVTMREITKCDRSGFKVLVVGTQKMSIHVE